MSSAAASYVTPPDEHLVTAREALEPLYEHLELQTDTMLMGAAVRAGWSVEEAEKALTDLRLDDALTTIERRPGG